MPIVDSIVVVGFGENDKAYEAFSELKSLSDQQKLTARSAAIVERDEKGTLQTKDSFDGSPEWRLLAAGLSARSWVSSAAHMARCWASQAAPSPGDRTRCAAATSRTKY